MLLLSSILVIVGFEASAQTGAFDEDIHSTIENTKRATVYIAKKIGDRYRAVATGFFIYSVKDSIPFLVTAKHVVAQTIDLKGTTQKMDYVLDHDLYVCYNTEQGKIRIESIAEERKQQGTEWIMHHRPEVDVAILPYLYHFDDAAIWPIPDFGFLRNSDLHELLDLFSVSFQPDLNDVEKQVNPIIRKGSVSLLQKNGSLIVDGTFYPGNSGSPVFRQPFWGLVKGKSTPVRINTKFVGVVGSYIIFRDIALSDRTGKPRMTFEENSGLAVIWPADVILEILGHPNTRVKLSILKHVWRKKK